MDGVCETHAAIMNLHYSLVLQSSVIEDDKHVDDEFNHAISDMNPELHAGPMEEAANKRAIFFISKRSSASSNSSTSSCSSSSSYSSSQWETEKPEDYLDNEVDANGDDSVIVVRGSGNNELESLSVSEPPDSDASDRTSRKKRRIIEIAEPCIDDFELVRTLGIGAFGRVFLVKFRGDEEATNGESFYYAMKSVKKTRLIHNNDEYKHIMAEQRVLSNACVKEHPFIVKFMCSFHSTERVFYVTEFLPGGELFQLLARREKLSEDEARFYLAEVTLALEFLHRLGVLYRDLKPENVLINHDGHLKLIDFGLAKDCLESESQLQFGTCCGTKGYMSPEVAHGLPYGVAADWWTLGALAYDLLVGAYPFTSDDYSKPVEYPKYISHTAREFLRELLRIDYKHRLGSPMRGGSDSVKKHAFFEPFNWSDVFRKRLKPPVVPSATAKNDLSCIDPEFLRQPAVLSTVSKDGFNNIHRQDHQSVDQDFAGFSYVNPDFYCWR